MEHHYKEEVGHEKYALRDAEKLGLDAQQLPANPEAQSQYDHVYESLDKTITGFFGYAIAMENISQHYGPYMAKRVIEGFKVEPTANYVNMTPASFLALHAEVDQEHTEDGYRSLKHMKGEEEDLLIQAIKNSFKNYRNFLLKIMSQTQAHAA